MNKRPTIAEYCAAAHDGVVTCHKDGILYTIPLKYCRTKEQRYARIVEMRSWKNSGKPPTHKQLKARAYGKFLRTIRGAREMLQFRSHYQWNPWPDNEKITRRIDKITDALDALDMYVCKSTIKAHLLK